MPHIDTESYPSARPRIDLKDTYRNARFPSCCLRLIKTLWKNRRLLWFDAWLLQSNPKDKFPFSPSHNTINLSNPYALELFLELKLGNVWVDADNWNRNSCKRGNIVIRRVKLKVQSNLPVTDLKGLKSFLLFMEFC